MICLFVNEIPTKGLVSLHTHFYVASGKVGAGGRGWKLLWQLLYCPVCRPDDKLVDNRRNNQQDRGMLTFARVQSNVLLRILSSYLPT